MSECCGVGTTERAGDGSFVGFLVLACTVGRSVVKEGKGDGPTLSLGNEDGGSLGALVSIDGTGDPDGLAVTPSMSNEM